MDANHQAGHISRLGNGTWCLHVLQPTQHFAVLNVFTARLKARTCIDEDWLHVYLVYAQTSKIEASTSFET
jgi:hypothetical protein